MFTSLPPVMCYSSGLLDRQLGVLAVFTEIFFIYYLTKRMANKKQPQNLNKHIHYKRLNYLSWFTQSQSLRVKIPVVNKA